MYLQLVSLRSRDQHLHVMARVAHQRCQRTDGRGLVSCTHPHKSRGNSVATLMPVTVTCHDSQSHRFAVMHLNGRYERPSWHPGCLRVMATIQTLDSIATA